jgi:hypothetical protein
LLLLQQFLPINKTHPQTPRRDTKDQISIPLEIPDQKQISNTRSNSNTHIKTKQEFLKLQIRKPYTIFYATLDSRKKSNKQHQKINHNTTQQNKTRICSGNYKF